MNKAFSYMWILTSIVMFAVGIGAVKLVFIEAGISFYIIALIHQVLGELRK